MAGLRDVEMVSSAVAKMVLTTVSLLAEKLENILVDKLDRLWASCQAELKEFAKDLVEVDM